MNELYHFTQQWSGITSQILVPDGFGIRGTHLCPDAPKCTSISEGGLPVCFLLAKTLKAGDNLSRSSILCSNPCTTDRIIEGRSLKWNNTLQTSTCRMCTQGSCPGCDCYPPFHPKQEIQLLATRPRTWFMYVAHVAVHDPTIKDRLFIHSSIHSCIHLFITCIHLSVSVLSFIVVVGGFSLSVFHSP